MVGLANLVKAEEGDRPDVVEKAHPRARQVACFFFWGGGRVIYV